MLFAWPRGRFPSPSPRVKIDGRTFGGSRQRIGGGNLEKSRRIRHDLQGYISRVIAISPCGLRLYGGVLHTRPGYRYDSDIVQGRYRQMNGAMRSGIVFRPGDLQYEMGGATRGNGIGGGGETKKDLAAILYPIAVLPIPSPIKPQQRQGHRRGCPENGIINGPAEFGLVGRIFLANHDYPFVASPRRIPGPILFRPIERPSKYAM